MLNKSILFLLFRINCVYCLIIINFTILDFVPSLWLFLNFLVIKPTSLLLYSLSDHFDPNDRLDPSKKKHLCVLANREYNAHSTRIPVVKNERGCDVSLARAFAKNSLFASCL